MVNPKTFLILAFVAAVIANILANLLASLLEKVASEHPAIKRLNAKQQFTLVLVLFILFSTPSIYAELDKIDALEILKPQPNEVEQNINSDRVQIIKIRNHETTSLFGGDVFITVNNIGCPAPSDGPVDFMVGALGYENKTYTKIIVGSSVSYTSKSNFEVSLLDVEGALCSIAEFQVTNLDIPDTSNSSSENEVREITARVNETISVYGGDLLITVTSIGCPVPSDAPVSFKVVSPDFDEIEISEISTGSSITYQGKEKYGIVLSDVNGLFCTSADFQIKKIE